MSEDMNAFNAQEEIERLTAAVEDHEKSIDLLEERLGQTMQLVNQMDMFLREMLRAGHFETTVKRLQGGETEQAKIII
jgi:hypothetical protein